MQPSRWENQRERTGSLGQALSSSTRHNRISGRQQTASERLCHGRGSSVFQGRRRFVRGSHDQPSCRQRRPARPCVAAAARNGHAHWVSSASTRLARKIQRHSCDIFGGRRNKSAPRRSCASKERHRVERNRFARIADRGHGRGTSARPHKKAQVPRSVGEVYRAVGRRYNM